MAAVDNSLVLRAPVNAVLSGDNTIVAAPGANKLIVVHSIYIVASAVVTVNVKSAAAGTIHVPNIKLADAGQYLTGFDEKGLFECDVNALLNFNTTVINAVYGMVSYIIKTL